MLINSLPVRWFLLLVVTALIPLSSSAQTVPFTWDNAVVYFAMTDRFANGSESNDHSYGRGFDADSVAYPVDDAGFFWGGDFAGLTAKIEEGYFNQLGVSAIWISPPFEQVHGWVSTDGGEQQQYAYHGYWILDPTEFDANFGTAEEFRLMVETAHVNNIRILVDVILNHPGYATLADMDKFDFGVVDSTWRGWRPGSGDNWESYHNLFVDYQAESDSSGWADWWGSDWIRAGLPGYDACGSTDLDTCLFFLPDFKTESTEDVEIPVFLQRKWSDEKLARETKELNSFFNRTGLPRTPANHLIKWVSDLPRKYGIDGYRIDTAKHVEDPVWDVLIGESRMAHEMYWSRNAPPSTFVPGAFWTVAEIFGLAPGPEAASMESSFDAYINFEVPYKDLSDVELLDSLYSAYADHVGSPSQMGFMSYMSSHDTGFMSVTDAKQTSTRFALLPGAIQLLYGDESGRAAGMATGSARSARVPMNWESTDEDLLAHWQMILNFRASHPAIGAGEHELLSTEPYTFRRGLSYGTYHDEVVVVLGAKEGRTRVSVSKSSRDDTMIRDVVSGRTGIVTFGYVSLPADPSGIMLLEEVR